MASSAAELMPRSLGMWARMGEELCAEALLHQPELVAKLPDLLLSTVQVTEPAAGEEPRAPAPLSAPQRKLKRNISEVLDLLEDPNVTSKVRRGEHTIDEVLQLLDDSQDVL
mmetsp:Transcript_137127/g.333256  ORF Transcript_137127/g.333256 Transcript_137127/m.333256 type:complete len:112 (+) Transcript_137127:54-389(+)